uniref:Neural proliferation, differentiation and control, 1b n=1 Tax=Scleropages formosus TaxID=113540 RepID=A0A8C9VYZ1_SCLFO
MAFLQVLEFFFFFIRFLFSIRWEVLVGYSQLSCDKSNTMSDKCPRSLDCAREGRHFCRPGSSHCGPCLTPLEENTKGKCVVKKRHSHIAKVTTLPDLDEEIDFLSSIIAKQQEAEVKHAAPSPQDAPKSNPGDPKQWNTTNVPTASPGTKPAPTSPPQTGAQSAVRREPLAAPYPTKEKALTVMTGVFLIMGVTGLLLAGVCWIRQRRGTRLTEKVDYPAFRVMGPHSFDSTMVGDKKLAQSAQMYHYQHQKQQMLSLERHRCEPKIPDSGATSDEENEDGDFTVYECPGLAPTGEMEVKNPLFDDSSLHPQRNHK